MSSKKSTMFLVALFGGCGLLLAGCGAPMAPGEADTVADTVAETAARPEVKTVVKSSVERKCDDCGGEDDPPPRPSPPPPPPPPQCKPEVFANAVAQAWADTGSMAANLKTVKEFCWTGLPAMSFCFMAADYAEWVQNSVRDALNATNGCRADCRTVPWAQLEGLRDKVTFIMNELRRDCGLAVLPFGGLFVTRLDGKVSDAQSEAALLASGVPAFAACVR